MARTMRRDGDPGTIYFLVSGEVIRSIGLCGEIAREICGAARFNAHDTRAISAAFGTLEAVGYSVYLI